MRMKLLAAMALSVVSLGAGASEKDRFVAHEWGTFTSVQGADGQQLTWAPLISTDLPTFVYNRSVRNGGLRDVLLLDSFGKGQLAVVRMETPVIYFYSASERRVDVRVGFPQGSVTEWYPQATHVGPSVRSAANSPISPSGIEWNHVTVLARETREISAERLIRDPDAKANHYYAARATDANLLRVVSSLTEAPEYERDLFYRGVGSFKAPLIVKTDPDEKHLTLATTTTQPLLHAFVLTIRGGMASYRKADSIPAGKAVRIELDQAPLDTRVNVRDALMRDMSAALVSQGLYPREAAAMVDTWKDQWFAEEGTRVLYLLPRAWTDSVLPLEITPKPEEVVRVMVGRAEVITPSVQQRLTKQISTYSRGDAAAKQRAVADARALHLGRFFSPAVQLALGNSASQGLQDSGWKLLTEVTDAKK